MRESCPGPEMIGTYLEGGLPEAERDELEAHAAECEDCAAVVAAAGGQAQAVQLSEAFEKRILGVFPKTKGGTSRRRVPRRRARPAVLPRAWFLTAAMAAAVLLVGFAIFGGKPEARRAGKEPERESVVAEAPAPGEEIAREAVRTVAAPAPEEVKRDETTLAVLEPTEEAALAEAPAEEPEGIRAPEEAPELAAVPERESETEEPMARVARVRGLVMYARGAHGRWARASEGIGLLSGDRLDTRTGAARIDLDGAVVCANSRTVLVLSAVPAQAGVARARPGAPAVAVELTRGDILVKDEGLRVSVRVVGGAVSPMGTLFGVHVVGARAEVSVLDGHVVVENEHGKVTVAGGHVTSLSRGVEPSVPRRLRRARAYAWAASLAPELGFAGRLAGPALYTMRGRRLKAATVELPGVGRVRTLEGWTFTLGAPWAVGEAERHEAGVDARRWQPARRGDYRSHALVGGSAWSDYEVVFAFRVVPGSVEGQANSITAIVYQGAGRLELYRLGIWGLQGTEKKLRCVRGFGGETTVTLPSRMPDGGRVRVRPGAWYRVRFGARSHPDRVELRGKLWPAAVAEPAGWSCIAADRSAGRLVGGAAGVGLQSLHAEIAEFAVHRLTDW